MEAWPPRLPGDDTTTPLASVPTTTTAADGRRHRYGDAERPPRRPCGSDDSHGSFLAPDLLIPRRPRAAPAQRTAVDRPLRADYRAPPQLELRHHLEPRRRGVARPLRRPDPRQQRTRPARQRQLPDRDRGRELPPAALAAPRAARDPIRDGLNNSPERVSGCDHGATRRGAPHAAAFVRQRRVRAQEGQDEAADVPRAYGQARPLG